MYDRIYHGKTLRFEPSGGLLNGSLVMQDKETDTYWSIMVGEAISGQAKGTRLKELPGAEKMTWKKWRSLHPDTEVLSVKGLEDIPFDPYRQYYASNKGFAGEEAADRRLPSKEPVFVFQIGNQQFAVPFKSLEGGKVFSVGGRSIFLFRHQGAPFFESTLAFQTTGRGFRKEGAAWIDLDSGARFDPDSGQFKDPHHGRAPAQMGGFDSFWYNWSLTHPGTHVL